MRIGMYPMSIRPDVTAVYEDPALAPSTSRGQLAYPPFALQNQGGQQQQPWLLSSSSSAASVMQPPATNASLYDHLPDDNAVNERINELMVGADIVRFVPGQPFIHFGPNFSTGEGGTQLPMMTPQLTMMSHCSLCLQPNLTSLENHQCQMPSQCCDDAALRLSLIEMPPRDNSPLPPPPASPPLK